MKSSKECTMIGQCAQEMCNRCFRSLCNHHCWLCLPVCIHGTDKPQVRLHLLCAWCGRQYDMYGYDVYRPCVAHDYSERDEHDM